MKLFITLTLLAVPFVLFCQEKDGLTFSEIMFNPAERDGEFIEIYNLNTADSIDLSLYGIKYQTSKEDDIIPLDSSSFKLPPHSFAVILEGDYDFETGVYPGIIPADAVIFFTGDNAFGSSGMANSSDRSLYLISPSGDTVDSYTYTADNDKGISDEKIIESGDSDVDNWKNSKIQNGTPGFRNSVTPLEYNLEIKSLKYSPSLPFEDNSVTLGITILNSGMKAADNFNVDIYKDTDSDSLPSPFELIFSQSFSNLPPGDSILIGNNLGKLKPGSYSYIAKINFQQDEDNLDNFKLIEIIVYEKPHSYLDAAVNEIMYAPQGDEPEWFELYNNSGKDINLRNWTVADNSRTVVITEKDLILHADSYVVVSKDSVLLDYYDIRSPVIIIPFPYLNNGGDAVVIKDSLGILIDSVYYSPDWGGGDGKSLERIDTKMPSNSPDNWASARSGITGTPGEINSVARKEFDVSIAGMTLSPKNFTAGKDISVSLTIKNIGKTAADFDAAAYADNDRDSLPDEKLYSSGFLHLESGNSLTLNDAFVINNVTKPLGLLLKANFNLDQDTTNNYLYRVIKPGYERGSLIINEIMFDPAGGEPEWVEVFNRTSLSISPEGMSISDALASPTTVVIPGNKSIPPNSYFILSRDSSILDYHRAVPGGLSVCDLPVLNNDQDAVVLKDANGNILDSVYYYDTWGAAGYSIERRSADAPSNSPDNWGTSTDVELSTPGRPNSLRTKEYDLSLEKISSLPPHPSRGEKTNITAAIINNGTKSAENLRIKFYVESDGKKSFLSEEAVPLLNFADSVSIRSSASFIMPSSGITASAEIDFPEDEDFSDNSLSKDIIPGYEKGSVMLNEMMVYPGTGQSEWIELVNNSGEIVNLNEWILSDVIPRASTTAITDGDLFLNPGEYVIIADDSSFFNRYPKFNSKIIVTNLPALGNSDDGIVLYDFNGKAIDSLRYSNEWNIRRGRSLERISLSQSAGDSTNWIPSIDKSGGTPGRKNSAATVKDYSLHDAIINEIMADPGKDNSEFVELLNISGKNIDLGGWEIYDEHGDNFYVSEYTRELPPGKYFLIAADSLLLYKYSLLKEDDENILGKSDLGLANGGGLLLLKDIRGNTIDSLYYHESWHNKNYISTKNISLEKINPYMDSNNSSNWSSSADPSGATPARKNSIYSVNTDSQSKISVSPNPFSPDNDGFEDFSVINYSLPQTTAQVIIKIYDSIGRLVRTLANNIPSGSHGSVIFNGLDDSGRPLRIGIYIIYLEAINETTGTLENMKTVVVVARKL